MKKFGLGSSDATRVAAHVTDGNHRCFAAHECEVPAEFEKLPVDCGLYYDRRYVTVPFLYCFSMHNMRCREIGGNGWVPFFLVKENPETAVVAGHTVNSAKKAGAQNRATEMLRYMVDYVHGKFICVNFDALRVICAISRHRRYSGVEGS